MRVITIALLGSFTAAAALAQTSTTPASHPTAPGVTSATPNPSTGVPAGTEGVNRNTGPAAASGGRNQAVATTNANAPQPARGANSFTDGEARRRIESNGYTEVTGLQKDAYGIWHGSAKKGGNTVKVWLDYKGNVGTSA